MKKAFTLILSLCLTILCSCNNKSSDVTPITTGLLFTAEFQVGETSCKYDTKISSNGDFSMIATSPKEIEGMEILISNNEMKFKFKDLEYETSTLTLPSENHLDLIYNVFQDINKNNRLLKTNQRGFYISAKTEKYDYTAVFGQTGLPIRLSCSDKTTVFFKNTTIKR